MEEEKNKINEQYNIEKKNEEIINRQIEQIQLHMVDMEKSLEFMRTIREYRNQIYQLKENLQDYLVRAYESKNAEVLTQLEDKLNKSEAQRNNISIADFLTSTGHGQKLMKNICAIAQEMGEYPMQALVNVFKAQMDDNDCEITLGCRRNEDGIGVYHYFKHHEDDYFLDRFFFVGVNGLFVGTFTINEEGICPQVGEIVKVNEKGIQKLLKEGGIAKVISNNKKGEGMKELERDTVEVINTMKIKEVIQYYEKELQYWEQKNLEKKMEFTEDEQYLE